MKEEQFIDKDSQIIVNLAEYTEFKKFKGEIEKMRSQRFYTGNIYVDMNFKRFWGLSNIRFYSAVNTEDDKHILENQIKLHLDNLWPRIEQKIKELYSNDSQHLEYIMENIEKRRSNWLFKLYELFFGKIKID